MQWSLGRRRQQTSAAGDSPQLQSSHGDSCAPPPRLLEAQLQTQSRQHKDELEALHTQIELLRDDIEKKQELLNYTAALSPEAKVEYSVQQEITRLTNDNLVRHSLGRGATSDSLCWFHSFFFLSSLNHVIRAIIMHCINDILGNVMDFRGWANISLGFSLLRRVSLFFYERTCCATLFVKFFPFFFFSWLPTI